MAKQKELGEWTEKPPAAVQEAVDDYVKAMRAKGRALGKLNTAKDVCIEQMLAADVHRVRVEDEDGKPKWLIAEDLTKLKFEKITENGEA